MSDPTRLADQTIDTRRSIVEVIADALKAEMDAGLKHLERNMLLVMSPTEASHYHILCTKTLTYEQRQRLHERVRYHRRRLIHLGHRVDIEQTILAEIEAMTSQRQGDP